VALETGEESSTAVTSSDIFKVPQRMRYRFPEGCAGFFSEGSAGERRDSMTSPRKHEEHMGRRAVTQGPPSGRR